MSSEGEGVCSVSYCKRENRVVVYYENDKGQRWERHTFCAREARRVADGLLKAAAMVEANQH